VAYTVKEAYFTLQGEGAQTGQAAVFCRFAGCNLWSGREADRAKAICNFCDTDFLGTDGPGGGRFGSPSVLAQHIRDVWDEATAAAQGHVVFTGGEPTLQLDEPLIAACHDLSIEVSIETNGTRHVPSSVDWICVSPKAGTRIVQTSGHELKLVYPQPEHSPDVFADLDFRHFFLQPMDGANQAVNTAASIEYCKAHPQWRLSLQTHKLIGLP
jgi:7-carboxy-7-deazaguanine synthase